MPHIITLENVCGEYKLLIASSSGKNGYKRLIVYIKISPSNIEVQYKISHDGFVKYIGTDIDMAIQRYNNINI